MNILLNFLLGRGHLVVKTSAAPLSYTVIIPAFNEEEVIAATISSVLQQSIKPAKIIVVDDCSTDNTPHIVKKFSERNPSVTLHRLGKNSGSKAQALGNAVGMIDTEIAIFVDADTTLEPDSVKELMYGFSDSKVGVVCGSPFTKTIDSFFEKGRFVEYLLSYSLVKTGQQNFNSVLVATGCFFGVRTKVLQSFKDPFEDRTFAEDMDFTWKMIEETNLKILYAKDARCFVSDPADWKTYRSQMKRWIHGFFQCMKVRKMNTWKKKKLGFFSYMYLSSIFFYVLISTYMLIFSPFSFFLSFLSYILIMTFFAMKAGSENGYKKLHVLTFMPQYFALNIFINPYLYATFMFNEFVLKKSVKHWVKGH